MLRVRDFDVSLRFWRDGLGMRVVDRFEIPARRVSAMFVGFGDYHSAALIELSCPWDRTEPCTPGTGFGHIAVGVPDVPAALARLCAHGGAVIEPPQVMLGDGPQVAIVRDPDGYAVELIQTLRPD
jgi:lactoylglutathione lyase